MMERIEKMFFSLILKTMPNLAKLNTLSEAIDDIRYLDDGSLYIRYKNNLVTETMGGNYTYTKNGYNVTMGSIIHFNPNKKDVMDMVKSDFNESIDTINNETYLAFKKANLENNKKEDNTK